MTNQLLKISFCGFFSLTAFFTNAWGHGSIVAEEDICVIQIGFFKAHFTVYQPETRGGKEYCEDLPDTGKTVFMLNYLHDSLKIMPVDFRIIRDVTNLDRYAKWEDIAEIEDIDSATVFYQPPIKKSDAVFIVNHKFSKPGRYIGIVTTRHPTKNKTYNAVFPFQVAGSSSSYLWVIGALILLLQAGYWISTGKLRIMDYEKRDSGNRLDR